MKLLKKHVAQASLLGLALAAAASAQAQSSVTLYGIVSQDLVYATNTTSGGKYRLADGRLNASRIGFKGSEDLGGGLYAIFDLESGISPDTGAANSTFWNRGSWVGLKGGFGTVTLGRHWNVNDDILGNFFIFGGYAVFSLTNFDYASDLVNNSVKYVSPNFGGFTAEALVGLGEGTAPRTAEIAGNYAAGPLKAALTYHQREDKSTGLKDKLTAGGVAYDFGFVNARLGYATSNNQIASFDSTPGFPKASAFDIGADLKFGVAGLSVDYVNRDLKNSSDDSHFVRLLGTYNFSKRTQVNVNAVFLKNKGAATQSFYGINGINGPGKTQNVYTVGLSHNF